MPVMQKRHITILGAGNMASALGYHLSRKGNKVILYCIEPEVENSINKKHLNDKYLSGVRLPQGLSASGDIGLCVKDAWIVIMAVPSPAVPEVLAKAKKYLHKDTLIASISKGLDGKTLQPVILKEKELLPAVYKKRLCMLGGPAIANELVKGSLTAFVVAGEDAKARKTIANLLTGFNVKAAQSEDLAGVALAAALKNAYAIALGFCDGLQYPTNAKALVVTLAVSEMAGILLRSGADPKTAPSLAGLGDLLVTGWSPHGRNRQYGELLVHAKTADPKKLGLTTVEGIPATKDGLKLAKKLGARTPMLKAIYQGINSKSKFHLPFVKYLANLKLDLI